MDNHQLLTALDAAGVDRRAYDVKPGPSAELPRRMDVPVLAQDVDGRWYSGFGERGSFEVLRYFDSEDEACDHFYRSFTAPESPRAERLAAEETLRRRAGELLPRTLDALDGWVAANRADLERRGVTVRVEDAPQQGVRRRIRLAAGTRQAELSVGEAGRDSAYRQTDTGEQPVDLGNRVQLVHQDTVRARLDRLAGWLRV